MTKGLWEQSSTNILNKSNKQYSGLRKFIWWVNKPLQGSASDGRMHRIAATNCWDTAMNLGCIQWGEKKWRSYVYVGITIRKQWHTEEDEVGRWTTSKTLLVLNSWIFVFLFLKLNTDTKTVSPKIACIHSFQLGRNAMPPLSISF